MATFAEQLRALANPEPSRFDLDDDEFDLTRAQITNRDTDVGNLEEQKFSRGNNLRKKAVTLLQDEDKKYAGRKITRAQLEVSRDQADRSDTEEESAGENEFQGTEYEGDFPNGMGESEDDDDDDDAVENEGSEDDSDDIQAEEEGEEGEEELEDDEGSDAIQKFSATSLSEDIEKGKAARNQLSLWDSFLELRIRLQKALLVANKLPQQKQIEEFKSSGDKNLKDEYKHGKRALAKLLGNLLLVQEKLLEQNPDTASVLIPGTDVKQSSAHGSNDDDDEEIPSDTEDEKSDDDDDVGENSKDENMDEGAENSLKLPAKRKHEMATSEYAEYISKRHAAFKSYRDATISKWSEKTRLASGKLNSKSFSSFDRSALAQINHILSDKDRLIKRTQLKRSAYRVLGKSEEGQRQNMESSEEQSDVHLRDYDPEIFDDDDFYHQLLREFIEQRTSGSTGNPIEMGRQWLELQKLRRKVKKKVDTKASKGRKIRYDIHGKLVSFMAPIEKGAMVDSSRNELFSSLFGTKQQEQVADINIFR
ncbi:protein AATF-like [Porites lutea]|uniref:protein AATF-like n=1 Tax=Porites lutea TaxID=51062 RepID=UPI003CC58296